MFFFMQNIFRGIWRFHGGWIYQESRGNDPTLGMPLPSFIWKIRSFYAQRLLPNYWTSSYILKQKFSWNRFSPCKILCCAFAWFVFWQNLAESESSHYTWAFLLLFPQFFLLFIKKMWLALKVFSDNHPFLINFNPVQKTRRPLRVIFNSILARIRLELFFTN